MRLVQRAPITVTPRQPYFNWANALNETGVKLGEGPWLERHVYLIADVSNIVPFDRDAIVRPYFKVIFEEELNSWYRQKSAWPSPRTYETFLAWFDVEVHSTVLDLQGGRLIHTESYG